MISRQTLSFSPNKFRYGISYQKTGKWILACSEPEIHELEKIRKNASNCGVVLNFLSQAELQGEPNVHVHILFVVSSDPQAIAGLNSPQTGIIDSHELMAFFEQQIQQNGSDVALRYLSPLLQTH